MGDIGGIKNKIRDNKEERKTKGVRVRKRSERRVLKEKKKRENEMKEY